MSTSTPATPATPAPQHQPPTITPKLRQIDTCVARYEPNRGFIVVSVDGLDKHAIPQTFEPPEDLLRAAESECLAKFNLILRSGAKSTTFAPRSTKTEEYKRTADHCYSHITENKPGEGCLRIDNDNPAKLLQWQHSFANYKSKLKHTDEEAYKKACFVSTRMMPRNKLTNEPAYLLITPRYWDSED